MIKYLTHCPICSTELVVSDSNNYKMQCLECDIESYFKEKLIEHKKQPSVSLELFEDYIDPKTMLILKKFYSEHMSEIGWSFTNWDYGILMFCILMSNYGYPVSIIYRKGKIGFGCSVRNRQLFVSNVFCILEDAGLLKGFSFTKNMIYVTINLKIVEENMRFE